MMNSQKFYATPKRNALEEVTNVSPIRATYVSPTINLKLLTNVALQNTYHRKEKSLQILCDRFLELYPLYEFRNTEIHLAATAQTLGVEKRRIYDIINILEAIMCTTHRRKNTYIWHGASRLSNFLCSLKLHAETYGVGHAYCFRKNPQSVQKRRSLGTLAQRFLMMFLVRSANTYINLEMAVATLICQIKTSDPNVEINKSDRVLKSKIRRLYDIANVLCSIGLIEKVSIITLKKPVFRYVGVNCSSATPICSTMLTPESLTINSTVIHPVPVKSKRRLFSPCPETAAPVQSATPSATPTNKWYNMLEVANKEWHRLNDGNELNN